MSITTWTYSAEEVRIASQVHDHARELGFLEVEKQEYRIDLNGPSKLLLINGSFGYVMEVTAIQNGPKKGTWKTCTWLLAKPANDSPDLDLDTALLAYHIAKAGEHAEPHYSSEISPPQGLWRDITPDSIQTPMGNKRVLAHLLKTGKKAVYLQNLKGLGVEPEDLRSDPASLG